MLKESFTYVAFPLTCWIWLSAVLVLVSLCSIWLNAMMAETVAAIAFNIGMKTAKLNTEMMDPTCDREVKIIQWKPYT